MQPQSERRLRVLLVVSRLPPAASGTAAYTAQLAADLDQRGHEVFVFTYAKPSPDSVQIRGFRALLFLNKVGVRLGFGESTRRLSAALATLVAARKIKPDVLEAPEVTAELLLLRCLRHRPAVLLQLHGPLAIFDLYDGPLRGRKKWDHRLANWMDRRAARNRDVVSAPSLRLVEVLSGLGWPLNADSTTVLPLGCVAPPSPEFVGERRLNTFVFVLRDQGIKGADLIPDIACRILRDDPDSVVRVFGIGDPHTVSRHASAPDEFWGAVRGGSLRFEGVVAGGAVTDAFRRAGALLVPSRFDNWPLVTMEACVAGLPIITTCNVGSAAVLAQLGAAELVDLSAPAFAGAALALSRDARRWSTMSRAGVAAAEGPLERSLFIEGHEALLWKAACARQGGSDGLHDR